MVTDIATVAYYGKAVDHANQMIADIKKVGGDKSGMYIKCVILPSNNTSKIVTNECRHRIPHLNDSCYLRSEIAES